MDTAAISVASYHENKRVKLLKSSAAFGAMTLISRLFGFIRDMVLARFFGAGPVMDAFVIAFRIPNLLRRLFAEGSFSLAFVPVLAAAREQQDPKTLKELINAVTGCLLAVLLLIVATGIVFAPWIIGLVVPGFANDPQQVALASDLLRIMFPYLMLVSLTALAAGILNTFGRFSLPALTPVMLNLSMIVAVVGFSASFDRPIEALAWGVFAAGFLQLLMLLPTLFRLGLLPRPTPNFAHPGVQRILKLMVPTLFGSSVAQINLLLDTLIASLLIAGSVSWLYYSERLMDLPLGIFGVALSTVILPTLSSLHARQQQLEFRATLEWALLLGLVIGMPAAAGLLMLAEPLMLTLFERGAFSQDDATWAGFALSMYCLGLPAFIGVKILAPAYFSRQDTATPVKVALVALLANIFLNIVFIGALMFAFTEPGESLMQRLQAAPGMHGGLALASAVAGWLNAGLLWFYLKRTAMQPRLPIRQIVRVVLSVFGMGLAVYFLQPPIQQWQLATTAQRAVWIVLTVSGGIGVYGLLLLISGLRIRHLIKPVPQPPNGA
ncbi:MAG: murein biosynthesis integral membrane protein MurJ [Symploca sp. SIO2G7]|nr:murein biosynthesis integral membrane protein MurJ [Symploca sp. SIO2G7]